MKVIANTFCPPFPLVHHAVNSLYACYVLVLGALRNTIRIRNVKDTSSRCNGIVYVYIKIENVLKFLGETIKSKKVDRLNLNTFGYLLYPPQNTFLTFFTETNPRHSLLALSLISFYFSLVL